MNTSKSLDEQELLGQSVDCDVCIAKKGEPCYIQTSAKEHARTRQVYTPGNAFVGKERFHLGARTKPKSSLDRLVMFLYGKALDYYHQPTISADGIDFMAEAKAAIVEAVEGIYGDSDGLREFASTGSNQAVDRSESTSIMGALLVYATRYAIGRHTYASAEVARYVLTYAKLIPQPDVSTLVKDIQDALLTHSVDEHSTVQWREALDKLTKLNDLVATDKEAR